MHIQLENTDAKPAPREGTDSLEERLSFKSRFVLVFGNNQWCMTRIW